MQISRDGEMAGTLIIWDFNYPDDKNNENCGVVKKAKSRNKPKKPHSTNQKRP